METSYVKNWNSFSDGMKVYPTKQESFVHFLVLTDVMGNKTYATCLTFCRKFIVEKVSKGRELQNIFLLMKM